MDKYKMNINNNADDDFPIEFEDLIIEPKYKRASGSSAVTPGRDIPDAPSAQNIPDAPSAQDLPDAPFTQARQMSVDEAAAAELEKRTQQNMQPEPAVKRDALDIDESIFDLNPDADYETQAADENSPDAYSANQGACSVESALGRFAGFPIEEGADPAENFKWFVENYPADGDDWSNAHVPASPSGDGYDFEPDDSDRFSYNQLKKDRMADEDMPYDDAYDDGLKHRKKGRGFRIGLLIYAIVLVLLFAGGNILLWKYIAAYENNSPEVVLEQVIDQLKEGQFSDLSLSTADGINLSDPEEGTIMGTSSIEDYLKDMLEGDIAYSEAADLSTQDERVYVVQANEADFVQIVVEQTGEKEFFNLLSVWKEKSASLMNSDYVSRTYMIQVPSGSKVYAADVLLDETYISGSALVNELMPLKEAGIISELPKYDIYTVSGLFDSTDIYTLDADGERMNPSYDEGSDMYTIPFDASADLISAETERINEMIPLWANYYLGIDYNDDLLNYVLAGSPASDSLVSAAINYIYDLTDVDNSDISVTGFSAYSDECYVCSVYFNENMWSGESSQTKTWDMTWIFYKSGDNYFLAYYEE